MKMRYGIINFELGFNYRMNKIQAALGLSQLKRLDQYVKRRHEIAAFYDNTKVLHLQHLGKLVYSSYHHVQFYKI